MQSDERRTMMRLMDRLLDAIDDLKTEKHNAVAQAMKAGHRMKQLEAELALRMKEDVEMAKEGRS